MRGGVWFTFSLVFLCNELYGICFSFFVDGLEHLHCFSRNLVFFWFCHEWIGYTVHEGYIVDIGVVIL